MSDTQNAEVEAVQAMEKVGEELVASALTRPAQPLVNKDHMAVVNYVDQMFTWFHAILTENGTIKP